MNEFCEVIKYSFYIFEKNFLDFQKEIDEYLLDLGNQGLSAFDITIRDQQIQRGEQVKRDIACKLHNYVSAWYSLKQQTIVAQKSLTDDSLLLEIDNQKGEMFTDNPENSFIQGLRNCIQHKQLPLTELSSSMSFNKKQPDFNIKYDLYLKKDELLEYNGWNASAKTFLNGQSAKIPIKEIIKCHYSKMEKFYQWLSQKCNCEQTGIF